MLTAKMKPHLVLEKQNVAHQGRDPTRPISASVSVFLDALGANFAVRTTPTFLSTVDIRLLAPGFSSLLLIIFSTASTTPSLHRMPIAVPPFSTALTAYST